jgi:hypothetical protein
MNPIRIHGRAPAAKIPSMGEDSLLERVTATAEDLETNFLHERTRQR